jgi:membrane-bound lytic murein transglycosylase A
MTAGLRRAGRLGPVALLLGLLACAAEPPPAPPAPPPAEPSFDLAPVGFEALEGWQADDPRGALAAFRRSCDKLRAREAAVAIGRAPELGRVADWLPACRAADEVDAGSGGAVRGFFESGFQPYAVTDGGTSEGLFTGYYEPLLLGSRTYGGRYRVPLRRLPADLVRVDLGRFNPDLAGYAIQGRIVDGQFIPYHSRAEIENGALAGRDGALLWVDDPIDKFFLQIQGSGQVRLDDGALVRVGYAGQNGHPYRAIGRDLIEIGAIEREQMSMQSIRAWLVAHPAEADMIMARNRSYVFFQEQTGLGPDDGPLGAQNVPLTEGRSLAVDLRYIPLGAPVWLETTAPWPEGDAPLRRLMVAQDTGGAIKGVVRGDVFWGAGPRAEAVAGRMRSQGRYFLLLPRTVVPTS